MSYHTGGAPTFATTRRARVGVTTVFYTPGAGGSGIVYASPPAVQQAPVTPIAYRIPQNLITPAVTSAPAYFAPAPAGTLPGQAASANVTPDTVSSLQNFLATAAQVSTNPQATTPPPALEGPVSNADGTPAAGIPWVPLLLIAGAVWLLASSSR